MTPGFGLRFPGRRLLVLVLSSAIALVACQSNSVEDNAPSAASMSSPSRGGILTMATDADPGSLDPNVSNAFASWYVTELVYGSLLRIDENGKIAPDAAASYDQPDALTYQFKLRPDVKFSNGRAVTSTDVKYSFDRILDPATGSALSAAFAVIKSIETPTADTVVFHLDYPFSPFLSYLAYPFYSPILDRETVEANGGLANASMGTGPFRLTSYQPGQQLTFERNPAYYDRDRPYLDGIRMLVMSNDTARLAAIRSGQVQAAWFYNPHTPKLVGDVPGLTATAPESYRNEELLAFNQTKAPFNNPDVRRAISEGIDREEMIRLILDGKGSIGSKIPPGAAPYGYSGDASGLPYNQYNPEHARELLRKAGYPNGLSVDLNVSPLYPRDVQTAEVMSDQLSKIGVTVNIIQKDWTTTLSELVSTSYDGMSMIGTVWQPDPDNDVTDIWTSDSPINLGKFNDPVIDDLLKEGRSAQTIEERTRAYHAAQQRVAEMAYMVFPYTTAASYLVVRDNEVRNFTVSDSGLHQPELLNTWIARQE